MGSHDWRLCSLRRTSRWGRRNRSEGLFLYGFEQINSSHGIYLPSDNELNQVSVMGLSRITVVSEMASINSPVVHPGVMFTVATPRHKNGARLENFITRSRILEARRGTQIIVRAWLPQVVGCAILPLDSIQIVGGLHSSGRN